LSGCSPRFSAHATTIPSTGISSSIGMSTLSDSSRASASRGASACPTCTVPSSVTCVYTRQGPSIVSTNAMPSLKLCGRSAGSEGSAVSK
jgi:hypothetical protein